MHPTSAPFHTNTHTHKQTRDGYSRMGCWRGECDSPVRCVRENQHFCDICYGCFLHEKHFHSLNCKHFRKNVHHHIISKLMPKKPKTHSCQEFQLNNWNMFPKLVAHTQTNHFPMLIVRMKLYVTVALFTHKPFIIPFPVIPCSIKPTCQHPISLILRVEQLKCCLHFIQRLEASQEDWPGPC